MATKPTRRKKKYSKEQIEAYHAAQREQAADLMKTAVSELLTSDGWIAWARVRARLHRYSFSNTMLILAQMPEARMVASAKYWSEQQRHPVKDSRALRVFAPLLRRPTAEEIAAGHSPDSKVLIRFKLVPVFDVSQTDGEPLPEPVHHPISGDSHAAYLRPLEVLAHELGFSVSFESLSVGLGGYCDSKAKHIAVSTAGTVNAQVRVLIHEIAHALGIGYEEHGREQAEVLVETATFIVCTSIGLDTTGSSVPYVATWGGADANAAIEKFAHTVDEVARRIETAVRGTEVTS